jgi:hypothetical protein
MNAAASAAAIASWLIEAAMYSNWGTAATIAVAMSPARLLLVSRYAS